VKGAFIMEKQELRMTESVYNAIRNTIGSQPAERGGMLGSSDGSTIDYYHYDETAATTDATYSPDVEALQKILDDWAEEGIEMMGFVHSHPRGCPCPSQEDASYAVDIILASGCLDLQLALPIVSPGFGGPFKLRGYYAEIHDCKEVIITDVPITIVSDTTHESFAPPNFHDRVESVCPLETMRSKILVGIGCGGARSFYEDLARMGIGRAFFFDGDVYSASNLATQQCYRDEIGVGKALAVASRVRQLDPQVITVAVPHFLDDDLLDEDFEAIIGPELFERPEDILIAACTDSFWAQDQAARLAIKYGTPYLAAQLYERGLAAEVLFYYPGVTPACPRCVLRPRYDEYLNGYVNTVGSRGVPIFATQRVNALKGYVSLMLLLYKESGPFAGLLDKVADRNMLQIRMSPDPDSPIHPLFHQHLGELPYTFFDETLWVTATPEPDCPYCQGGEKVDH